MEEVLYDHSSILIVLTLLVCTVAAMEIGVRRGRRKKAIATEAITQANAVLASMLGLLALLLAFTFSAALQRFDDRSQTVVAEANAIGTAYLRALLLPAGMRDEVRALLRQYWKFAFAKAASILPTLRRGTRSWPGRPGLTHSCGSLP